MEGGRGGRKGGVREEGRERGRGKVEAGRGSSLKNRPNRNTVNVGHMPTTTSSLTCPHAHDY